MSWEHSIATSFCGVGSRVDSVLSLIQNKCAALVPDRSTDLDVGWAAASHAPRLERAHRHTEEFRCLIFIHCGVRISRDRHCLRGAASLLATMRASHRLPQRNIEGTSRTFPRCPESANLKN